MSKVFKIFGLSALLAVLVIHTNCGDDSSSSSSSLPKTLGSLPKATGAVVNSNASFRGTVASSDNAAADSGLKLSAYASTTWDTNSSGSMCETIGAIKDLLASASEADKILCYIKEMEDVGAFSGSFDGNYHIYDLSDVSGDDDDDEESATENFRIRFKIVTDSSGAITSFVMQQCDGQSNSLTQSFYVSQTFNANQVTMTSVNVESGDDFSGGHRVSVTGAINSSGNWTEKSIVAQGGFTDSEFSDTQKVTLTQTPTQFELSGFFSGTEVENDESFSGAFFSIIEILSGTADSLTTLAVGDGSSKYSFSFVDEESNDATDTGTDSWSGDNRTDLNDATSGSFYQTANAGTVPAVESVDTVSFSSDEQWDCSGTAESIDLTSLDASGISACDTQFVDFGDGHVDCSASYDDE